ncbi:beta strand repeat-containing protein [Phaeobacter marinintestinus]|uniref:beta strand repeat-containing protein n=1 Tax=Falsiphaeobacter marinintestinus TaxID=1492905 RepID=UPI0011B4093C|nr:choice-of-anchor Q domain-containing protein [Phaeobacter marinintestinus]
MANFIVDTTADVVDAFDGVTSLREAIDLADAAAGADTITFEAYLSGQTIILDAAEGELELSTDVTIEGDIDGDNAADITISGGNLSRVFYVTGGTSTLDALTITGGNAGAGNGGGIYIQTGATANLINSAVTGNTAYFGGGIQNYGGALNLTNSTVSGNSADYSGGGIFVSFTATAVLNSSTVSGNYANSSGGGVFNNGTATMTNSTLSGNTAQNVAGGGIENFGAATLTNSTVSGNNSAYSGGLGNWGTATLVNSIVLGNTATTGAEYNDNGTFTVTNSLTGSGGETAADVFAAIEGTGGGLLADNGGTVQTIELLNDVLNPALDAGDDSVAPATDAAGGQRGDIVGVGNDGSNFGDLGALELREADSLIVTTTSDVVDAYDYQTSLREALAFANSNVDASTITFDAALSGATITLSGTELELTTDVTVDGDIIGDDDVADITIDGDGESRVFRVSAGTATLDALTITGGSSVIGGGVIIASGAAARLMHTKITGNSADVGGGIFNGGTITLTSSTISANYADIVGGGISNEGSATLTICTLNGNSADLYGGGFSNLLGGTVTLTNSTISGNNADGGGGILNGGTATLTNSTISGNSASTQGGGILNGGTATLTNSIVLGNNAGTGTEIYESGGTITATTSITSGTAADVFASLAGNGGGLLADNGGPVQTITLNSDVTNPALDAGNDAAAAEAGAMTDARGAIRVDDATAANNGANISDLGAVEAGSETPSLIVTIASDTVDAMDGETSLREALAFANSNTDASTITFDAALSGATVTLGGAELELSSDVYIDGDIDGDDKADVTISGNDTSRVFHIIGGTSTLEALAITDGLATGTLERGGALLIDASATLYLTNSTVTDSKAIRGGGVANLGNLTMTNSSVSGNTSGEGVGPGFATQARGGGMLNYGTLTLNESYVSANISEGPGGGIYSRGQLSVNNSSILDNVGGQGGGISNIGTINLNNSTLSGNAGSLGGGYLTTVARH